MKQMVFKVVKALLYPLIWCHRVIREAPLMDVDNALVGYSDWMRYCAPQDKTSHGHAHQKSSVNAVRR